MVAATSSHDNPDGLVEQLLNGTVLRTDRIEECRRQIAEGSQPDAEAVADALVNDALVNEARPPAG
jgi:anti-sigma28 factor (negative regulator of flagellin synthesis)